MRMHILRVVTIAVMLGVVFAGQPAAKPAQATGTLACPADCKVYLPMVTRGCTASGINYAQGLAVEKEAPPLIQASQHPDKNLAVRGYLQRSNSGITTGLLDYGPSSADPNGQTPPQFATLFSPNRAVVDSGNKYYQVYDWDWLNMQKGALLTNRPVTALGITTTVGEGLYLPNTSYRINQGYAAMVLYADESSITFKFTRDDSMATGYGLHIQNICTDPGLLALYRSLDQGERYISRGIGSEHYHLPYLAPGQQFGTARLTTIVIAVRDGGAFEDPRSCRGWWINYLGSCAPRPPGN